MKTPEQALSALAALCSRGEQAESDLRDKLRRWQVAPAEAERIIRHLKREDYLNEERYAHAFVRDKFRFNGWGRIKIAHELRQKQVDTEVIAQALEEIDSGLYRETLVGLLMGKARTVSNRPPQAARAALLRFAASRGFEADLCYSAVDQVLKSQNSSDNESVG